MPKFTKDYYSNTQGLKPSPLLADALVFLKSNGNIALDLGCGAGRDTKLLLEKGFRVIAVDNEPLTEQFVRDLSDIGNLSYVNSTFEDFDYKQYDLINARYSLPFNPPYSFKTVMKRVLESVNSGGLFVGQLFGVNDEWNKPGTDMTFVEESEIRQLFASFEIIKLNEKDEEGILANGSKKHWHVFDIIARQK